jgi:hypothetical protein
MNNIRWYQASMQLLCVLESPKIILLHYLGTGSVSDLAKGIKTALDTQAKS